MNYDHTNLQVNMKNKSCSLVPHMYVALRRSIGFSVLQRMRRGADGSVYMQLFYQYNHCCVLIVFPHDTERTTD